jgi:hypothetical protein
VLRINQAVQRLDPGIQIPERLRVEHLQLVKEMSGLNLCLKDVDLKVAFHDFERIVESLRVMLGDLYDLFFNN